MKELEICGDCNKKQAKHGKGDYKFLDGSFGILDKNVCDTCF